MKPMNCFVWQTLESFLSVSYTQLFDVNKKNNNKMILVNKIIIADNFIGSCSHIQESNKDSKKKVTTKMASTIFREKLIPQPYVDSQKISHRFYRNWI